MRLPMKPNALADSTEVLRSVLPSLNAVAIVCGERVLAAHDLEQRHDVGGNEEVQTDELVGPLGHRRHLVDVERRGVRGENRFGFHDRVELREDVLLDVHVFEDGFDHDVGIGQLAPIVGEFDRLAALPGLLLRQLALLHLVHEHAHHRLAGLIDRFVVRVDDDAPECRLART